MKLKVYLAMNDIRLKEFCAKISCTPNHMSRIINGHVRVGPRLAKDVEETTKGQVSQKEIMSHYKGDPVCDPTEQDSCHQS